MTKAATSTFITHIVLRPFIANGRELQVGEAVDASSWKHVEPLIEARFLRPATDVDKVALASRLDSPVRRVLKIRKAR